MDNFNEKTYDTRVVFNDNGIKVAVHIPKSVRDKSRKINQIYKILKPKMSAQTSN